MLSVDDDHLRMRSKEMTACLGLSCKTNPRKAVGPVQTTVHDLVLRFWLGGRYARKGEGCVKSFWITAMNMLQCRFKKDLTGLAVHALAFDRGYMSAELVHDLTALKAHFFGTYKKTHKFPFTSTEPRNDQPQLLERGVKREFWAKKKVNGMTVYALAFR